MIIESGAEDSSEIPTSASSKLVRLAMVLYGQMCIIPLICYCLLTHSGSKVAFPVLTSLYGYTFVLFLPATLLCIFKIVWLRWLLLLLASVFATYQFVRFVKIEEFLLSKHQEYQITAISFTGHLFMVLITNMYLF